MTDDGFWRRQRLLLIVGVALLAVAAGPVLWRRLAARPRPAAPPVPGTIDMRTIDVNRADAALLETLPRIGPALAARIVEERGRSGPYGDLEELVRRVKGLGPAAGAEIEPFVLFGGGER